VIESYLPENQKEKIVLKILKKEAIDDDLV
jgi:hypothetical protein